LRDSLADEERFLDQFAKEKVGVGFWDLDAGWYPSDQTKQWWEVGTWEPDTTRFPGGLKPLSNYMHTRGIKLILWFEPERVYKGTWLAKNHPEWIYGGAQGGLLKLGEPDCYKWMLERIDKLITSQGVDVYRQDFNIDPLDYWRSNDAPDRQGITEIRHIEAYQALWDELRRRHPRLIIDTCASGGRRNNLETLRRSVPILRSDDQMLPLDEQCHTYGISSWVPINGTGVTMNNDYTVRSCMAAIFGIGADVRGPVDWVRMRRLVGEWRELSRDMLGDYYPLTPYSLQKTDWIAWQWDVPESGEGMIQAFRREDAAADTMVLKLSGLDPLASYYVTDLDSGTSQHQTGQTLMETGLLIHLPTKPAAALIRYRKDR
jgi:alpha-galactosidase